MCGLRRALLSQAAIALALTGVTAPIWARPCAAQHEPHGLNPISDRESTADSVDDGNVVAGELGAALNRIIENEFPRFWGSVLATKDGQIVLAKGYGVANNTGAPMTGDTLLELASVSKAFTAAAILRLEMHGRLRLDDPISKHLPDVPADKHGVTIRHLLTHTSGVPQAEAGFREDTMEAMLRTNLAPAMVASPGDQFQYSNAGYWMLAAIVERASGRSFEEYLREEVLRPAGMMTSAAQTDPTIDLSRCADRRSQGRLLGSACECPYPLTWGYRGSGGVVTSAREMFAWDQALRGDRLLGEPQRSAMFDAGDADYALGWRIEEGALGRVASHSGGVAGFRVQFTRWLEADACVLVMTNEEHNPRAMVDTVVHVLLPGAFEPMRVTIRHGGLNLNEHGMGLGPEDSEARVRASENGGVTLDLGAPAGDVLVSVELPTGARRRLARDLLRFARQAESHQQTLPPVRLEIYTRAYPTQNDPIVLMGEGLTVEASPGTPHPEGDSSSRVTIIVRDGMRRFWPVIVKLNARAAKDLGERLLNPGPAR